MPYGKKSGFKMYGKSPMMKALIGKKKNLPENLKQAILDSPNKKYNDSAMKKYGCKKCKSAMCMCGAKHKK